MRACCLRIPMNNKSAQQRFSACRQIYRSCSPRHVYGEGRSDRTIVDQGGHQHLLLALAKEEGMASEALQSLDISYDDVMDQSKKRQALPRPSLRRALLRSMRLPRLRSADPRGAPASDGDGATAPRAPRARLPRAPRARLRGRYGRGARWRLQPQRRAGPVRLHPFRHHRDGEELPPHAREQPRPTYLPSTCFLASWTNRSAWPWTSSCALASRRRPCARRSKKLTSKDQGRRPLAGAASVRPGSGLPFFSGGKSQGKGDDSSVLKQFGTNLTQEARDGKLDPVIGREKEVSRMMEILLDAPRTIRSSWATPVWARPPSWKALRSESRPATCPRTL